MNHLLKKKSIKLKKCKVCGTLFKPYKTTDKYCSSPCYYHDQPVVRKPQCKPLPKPKIKKKRTKSPNKINKDLAWKWFSKYIRLRDCLKTTKTKDMGVCYTCSKIIPFKGSQAGHCISGRGNYILLDEDCVNLQCYSCNIGLEGNYDIFHPKKIREFSLEWFEEKKRLSKLSMDRDWLEEIEKYKDKYFELLYGKSKSLPF
jgi:hypothetical protein